ncbi:SusC/RagA family TonB-linked outer membrane protein [Epilithonimonas hungarica]|uniref:TonB-linked outer membrane protein, SusC/RagA family n=1 Tax=Epilithonimonas hungarica TaxID=454006 RepID=A0A1G7FMW4_9FLAO|nr:SusC/RagA family TonB-linked outer membrane protein [Epilithonimonas hungarica]MPS74391.1 SusC/RagA family TonB-linked outer membrane protein [Chryseobacterium sp.]SDE77203.1 TonB-linked outer membrane protein, SusC/RagA family [Epilithonimonas hungarica]
MNVKLRLLSVGVLFFTGQALMAQQKTKAKTDTAAVKNIEEVVLVGGIKLDPAVKLGSYTVVSKANFESTPVASIDEVLNGRVAGLTFSTNGGDPGSTNLITIRGVGSLIGTPNPLYVIDGVVVGKGSDNSQVMESWNPLASIDPNAIEKVAVLKDASATALYGARGANGVIVVTTKRGRYNQKTRFNLSTDMSVQDIAYDKQKYMNADEYLKWGGLMYVNQAYRAGQTLDMQTAIGQFATDSNYDGYTNESWQDAVQRKTSTVNTYNFSATGGGENTSFRLGGSYYQNEPLVLNSKFDRLSLNSAIDHKISDKFNLAFNANFTNVERRTYDDGGAYRNPWLTNWYIAPIYPVFNPDGTYNQTNLGNGNEDFNPVAVQNMDFMTGSIKTFVSSVNGEWQFAKGFYANSLYGIQYQSLDEKQFWHPDIADGLNYGGYVLESRTSAFDWNWNNSISFRRVLAEKHDIQAYLGMEYQEHKYYVLGAQADKLSSPLPYISFGTPDFLPSFFTREKWTQISYFSRLNYTFDSKYSFSGQMRRDGNSTLGNSKFGNFWSVAGSWNASNESFVPDFFSQLTLRANYGQIGNIPYADQWGASYNSLALISPSFLYGADTATNITQAGNQDLVWEISKQGNIGIDVGVFEGNLSASVDVYNRKTVDAIWQRQTTNTAGSLDSYFANVGTILNKGIEVTLNARPFNKGDFKWILDGNFAYNKNTVESLTNPDEITLSGTANSMRATAEGHLLGEYYTYDWAGVDPSNGDGLFWTDASHTETTNNRAQAQRVWQGISPFPKYTAGLKSEFRYKNLSLSLFFTGQFEYAVHNRWQNYILGDGSAINNQITDALYDSWTPTNTTASNPIQLPGSANPVNAAGPSTRWMRDGDHIRLKEAKISYSFGPLLKDAGIDNLTLYLRGFNLWLYTFDKSLTFDPEANSNAAGASWQGKGLYDYTSPIMRSISFGVSVDF